MSDRELLSRYLDGELGEDERRALEARLATDAALARELDALRALVSAAGALPRAVDPPPAAWSAIRARLETGGARPASRGVPWLAAAAVALVVLAGGFLLGRLDAGRTTAPPIAQAPDVPAVRDDSVAAPEDPADAVFAARDAVVAGGDPESDDVLRRNLEIIDQAVHRLHAALEEDPSNASLQRLLNAEYKRRGALLRRAAQDATMRT